MTNFGARVSIQGADIAPKWDGSQKVALSGMSIVWGRSGPYDKTEPGTASLRVVDPTGDWFGSGDLGGKSIVIYRTSDSLGERAMFRGRISRATGTRRRVYNPVSRTHEPVWIVTISAGDRLADAAATVLRGEMGQKSVEGPGGWGEQYTEERLSNLFERGAAKLFSDYDRVPREAVEDGTTTRRMHGQAAADQRSVLELLEQVYATVPLGIIRYDPEDNVVRVGAYANVSDLNLVYRDRGIRLDMPNGRIIDAGKIAVPDGLQGESTDDDAIDTVQVSYHWYGKDPNMTPGAQKRVIYTGAFTQNTTRHGADSSSNRILKIDTETIYRDPDEFEPGPGPVQWSNRFPFWLADRIVEIVDSLNGQVRLPTLRLDDRRLPLSEGVSDVYYRPYQQPGPLYFAGSVFNPLPNAGPQYQIIGGTLRYDEGWTHDLTVTPARTNRNPNLRLMYLFGNDTSDAGIGDFEPTIRIGDLANVTNGL